MINFIKSAITSVEGIKTLLFNDDYRNNFDYGNIKYPCAVLTPIPSVTYSTKNLIKESYELHLAVLDVVPTDYDGEALHRIQTNCSELGLKILRNLQVRTTMPNDAKFEMIMPREDEWLCGAMCNLQVTAKQPRCAGQPTYYEVQIEGVKKVTITENGKLSIRPSEGYDAIKGVDVSVEIPQLTLEEKQVTITSNGEVEILPTNADVMTKVTANVQVPPAPLEEKQVTITKAKTTEIITPDAEYGLSRVEVTTDIPLESKQITITENGTTAIEVTEGFEGIESVEVTTDVNTLQGLDFSEIYDQEQANELNQFYKAGVEYAKDIYIYIRKN